MRIIDEVDREVIDRPDHGGRRLSPDQAALVTRLAALRGDVALDVVLAEGERPESLRQKLSRAAKIAGVTVKIRRSPRGFYVALVPDGTGDMKVD